MSKLATRIFLTLLLAGVLGAAYLGYDYAQGGSGVEAEVVIEGLVVRGDSTRVDRLSGEELEAQRPDQALNAEVRLVNEAGDIVVATADEQGRFRIGPIRLSGHRDDVLTIVCPDSRTLCLSHVLPAEVYEQGEDEVVTVRWRFTLPPQGAQAPREMS